MSANKPTLRVSLGDTVPRRLPVVIERDGEEVELLGYVLDRDGPQRCPLNIQAEAESARRVYMAATGTGDDYRFDAIAMQRYIRDVLIALIPGLSMRDAELIAGNGDVASEMLEELGWWVKTSDASPEAPGEETAPTSQNSSPTSTPSMELVTG